ncbi:hypothetical protein BKA70DRAFT_1096276 [Coprinopsis sp. MPI-PUGE-AT-0042]|nr:hypothetical protein BKA70DRAFT_1096276 [Coprinopsis sp. MPI-PUGE-AT-0042]
MGTLIWHEWARLVAITASIYAVWSGMFGLFYRKYPWDFVGGTMRDPGGLQAAPSAAPMVAIIIKIPIVPALAMVLGLLNIAVNFPAPFLKGTALHRSFHLRAMLLVIQFVITILFYQGTNAAIYTLVALIGYTRAIIRGEILKEARENRGKTGAA